MRPVWRCARSRSPGRIGRAARKSVFACSPVLTIAIRFRSRGSRAIGLSTVSSLAIEMTPAQSGVSPRDLSLREVSAEPAVRAIGLGDEQQPRRLLVESMHDPLALDRRIPASGSPRPLSAFTSVPLQLPGAGWTTMPAGLSTTSEVLVLVDARPAGCPPRGPHGPRRAGSSTTIRSPSFGAIARLLAPAAHGDVAVGDQRRGLVAREVELLRRGGGRVAARSRRDQLVTGRVRAARLAHVSAPSLPTASRSATTDGASSPLRSLAGDRAACAAGRSSRDSDHASMIAPTVTARVGDVERPEARRRRRRCR